MRLSICMMVKNEEKNLRRCLDSLKILRESVESELIILDTGSTDSTVELAKQYTDKIYFKEWNHDFSEMRNLSISHAKGEWIFIIDADEELTESSGIIEFLLRNDKQYAAAAFRLINIVDSKGKVGPTLNTLRIFKRTKNFKYVNKVHNEPVVMGNVLEINATLMHYGYISDDSDLMERKFKRTSALLIKELENDPNNIYFLFQLGSTYDMHNDLSLSIEYYRKAFSLICNNEKMLKQNLYIISPLVKVLTSGGFYEEAIHVADKGLSIESTHIDLYFFRSICCFSLGRYFEGINNSEIYLDLLDSLDSLEIYKNPTIQLYTVHSRYECVFNMALAYNNQENYERAIEVLFELLNFKLSDFNLQNKVITLLVQTLVKVKKNNLIQDIYHLCEVNQWEWIDTLLIREIESSNSISDYLESLVNTPYKLGDLIKMINFINLPLDKKQRALDFGIENNSSIVIMSALNGGLGLKPIISATNNELLMTLLGKANESFEDLQGKVLDRVSYLEELSIDDTYDINIEKFVLYKYLSFNSLNTENSNDYFSKYMKHGIKLIQNKYTIEFICSLDRLRIENCEELFFIIIWNIMYSKVSDISLLHEATSLMPEIQAEFLKWTYEHLNYDNSGNDMEMKRLKGALIETIKILVSEFKYSESLEIIDEALEMMGDSLELLYLKSEILVKLKSIIETDI